MLFSMETRRFPARRLCTVLLFLASGAEDMLKQTKGRLTVLPNQAAVDFRANSTDMNRMLFHQMGGGMTTCYFFLPVEVSQPWIFLLLQKCVEKQWIFGPEVGTARLEWMSGRTKRQVASSDLLSCDDALLMDLCWGVVCTSSDQPRQGTSWHFTRSHRCITL